MDEETDVMDPSLATLEPNEEDDGRAATVLGAWRSFVFGSKSGVEDL